MLPTDADRACPSDGQLRGHLDDAQTTLSAHLETCADCAARMTTIAAAARLAARQIAGLDERIDAGVDVDAALRAARPAVPSDHRSGRLRRVPATLAAAVVGLLLVALVVVTPTGRQAAASFLASFRAERIEVITFDPGAPAAGLEELADIVEVDAEQTQVATVDDMAHAAQVAGFTPSAVGWVPGSVELQHTMAVPPSTVRLTFTDAAPELPAALRGASLVVSVPGAVISQYAPSGEGGDDLLMIAEAGQLTADAEGAPLADVREYLLGRPEIPEDLARQLLAIDDWTTTLPVPVPIDDVVWQETTVAGQPGLMLEDPLGTGLLWQRNGRIHAVGGTDGDIDALRRIADSIGG